MWRPYRNGETLGERGFYGGIIVRDEERDPGVRVVLERDCEDSPWNVACSIEGVFFYLRPVDSEEEAEYPVMLESLDAITELLPQEGDPEADTRMEAIQEMLDQFMDRFP